MNAKAGRPIKMQGVIGALAHKLTAGGLARILPTNLTSLGDWAANRSPFPALVADKLGDLMNEHNIKPMLYTVSCDPSWYVASTVFGWITWRWNKPESEGGGYRNRTRYKGSLEDLAPVHETRVELARDSGWPY